MYQEEKWRTQNLGGKNKRKIQDINQADENGKLKPGHIEQEGLDDAVVAYSERTDVLKANMSEIKKENKKGRKNERRKNTT